MTLTKKTLIQCCHNVYSVYRCICFCISVGQNLLFTSLQISVEPYFLNFRMLFPKLITDYRPTNDRLVTDIVNINKSVTLLYSYKPNSYVKFWQNDKLFHKKHFFTRKNVLLLKYTMLRICRIDFFRLDENMGDIHEKH